MRCGIINIITLIRIPLLRFNEPQLRPAVPKDNKFKKILFTQFVEAKRCGRLSAFIGPPPLILLKIYDIIFLLYYKMFYSNASLGCLT